MKTAKTLTLIFTLAIAFALIAGCSEESSSVTDPNELNTAPTDDDYDMIADDLGHALTDPVNGMLALWQPAPPMEDPGHDPDDHRDFGDLHDTTFTHHGFTTTIDFTFFDVDDNPSEDYDPEASVRMLRDLTTTGEHDDPYRQMQFDLESTLNMDNILEVDTIHVINETGTRTEVGEMLGRLRDQVFTWDAYHEWESTDINIHVNHEAHPYPLSGQVYQYSELEKTMTHGNVIRTFTIHVGSTTTFDGTNWALVEMDDGRQYYINLDDGRPHRPPHP